MFSPLPEFIQYLSNISQDDSWDITIGSDAMYRENREGSGSVGHICRRNLDIHCKKEPAY